VSHTALWLAVECVAQGEEQFAAKGAAVGVQCARPAYPWDNTHRIVVGKVKFREIKVIQVSVRRVSCLFIARCSLANDLMSQLYHKWAVVDQVLGSAEWRVVVDWHPPSNAVITTLKVDKVSNSLNRAMFGRKTHFFNSTPLLPVVPDNCAVRACPNLRAIGLVPWDILLTLIFGL